jgi:predicted dehydrogenase
MIDLLLDWFGQVDCVQAFGDSPTDDGPLDFRCRMTSGFDAVLLGMNGLGYDQFEIDLFFADHRLELADGGVVKRGYGAVQGRVYAGYTHLTDAPEILHRGIVGGFVETYRAVGDFLATGKPLGGCGPKDALAGLAIIDAALASARSGGKAIDPNAR